MKQILAKVIFADDQEGTFNVTPIVVEHFDKFKKALQRAEHTKDKNGSWLIDDESLNGLIYEIVSDAIKEMKKQKIKNVPDLVTYRKELKKLITDDVLPALGFDLSKESIGGVRISSEQTDLIFASENEALQYLSDLTGEKITIKIP